MGNVVESYEAGYRAEVALASFSYLRRSQSIGWWTDGWAGYPTDFSKRHLLCVAGTYPTSLYVQTKAGSATFSQLDNLIFNLVRECRQDGITR